MHVVVANLYVDDERIIIGVVKTSGIFFREPNDRCKDQFRLRSNTGMDPGPRSPNNEFVECGKKS